jgi:hypothetical protein
MKNECFELRHSVGPYVFVFGVLCFAGLLTVDVGFTMGEWGGVYLLIIPIAIYVLKIYFYDLKYSISVKDRAITMCVATWFRTPLAITTIRIADITSIKTETDDLTKAISSTRASRRIAIYDEHMENVKFIDISLKHFVLQDIRKLMEVIKAERADLIVPFIK